jgi:hypothetical protein
MASKNVAERAARIMQASWKRRPKWNASFAMCQIEARLASMPQSGSNVSKFERKRIASMGFHVPPSLGLSETPVDQFLLILAAVAKLQVIVSNFATMHRTDQ